MKLHRSHDSGHGFIVLIFFKKKTIQYTLYFEFIINFLLENIATTLDNFFILKNQSNSQGIASQFLVLP
jgi:hypothetical protein